MENTNVMAVNAAEKPVNKAYSRKSRVAKKGIMYAVTAGCMAMMFAVNASAATGVVNTSSFITTACTVLKSVICLIGAGVGVWGVVNLLEGYGNDNPGAKLP